MAKHIAKNKRRWLTRVSIYSAKKNKKMRDRKIFEKILYSMGGGSEVLQFVVVVILNAILWAVCGFGDFRCIKCGFICSIISGPNEWDLILISIFLHLLPVIIQSARSHLQSIS